MRLELGRLAASGKSALWWKQEHDFMAFGLDFEGDCKARSGLFSFTGAGG